MRESRESGSEGGARSIPCPDPYLGGYRDCLYQASVPNNPLRVTDVTDVTDPRSGEASPSFNHTRRSGFFVPRLVPPGKSGGEGVQLFTHDRLAFLNPLLK